MSRLFYFVLVVVTTACGQTGVLPTNDPNDIDPAIVSTLTAIAIEADQQSDTPKPSQTPPLAESTEPKPSSTQETQPTTATAESTETQLQNWLFFFLDKVVLAVGVGVVTSFIFLGILSRFRPKIEISPTIARGVSPRGGETVYRIKVINRTRDSITDIRAQLHLFRPFQTATGQIWKSKSIELKRSDPISIGKFDKKDEDAEYAFRFLTYDNLEETWSDDTSQFLRFRIFARHSTSGFGGLFHKDFRLKRESIKEGEFSLGDTFEIL